MIWLKAIKAQKTSPRARQLSVLTSINSTTQIALRYSEHIVPLAEALKTFAENQKQKTVSHKA